MDLWTAKVLVICWKRVEWHRPDRVMRQFGGIQSLDIQPIPSTFKRIDGRGRAETDWFIYHYESIVNWNDRFRYIVPITQLEGDVGRERRRYLKWFKYWASLYLLKPSIEPPTTYYPRSPSERYLVDYFVRTKELAAPFCGGTGDNASSMQLALDEIGALSARIDQSMYIDYDAAISAPPPQEDIEIVFPRRRSSRTDAGQEGRRRSTSDVPRRGKHKATSTQTPVMTTPSAAGPSTHYQPSFDLGFNTEVAGPSHATDADLCNTYGAMPDWMSPLMFNPTGYGWQAAPVEHPSIWQPRGEPNRSSDSSHDEQIHNPDHQLRDRPTHAPARYTPGSEALGRRRKK